MAEAGRTLRRDRGSTPASPTPEEFVRIFDVIPIKTYLFFATDNPEDYTAVAYVLHWNRRYGSNEIHHEDLRSQAEALTIATGGRDLPEERFQPMVDALHKYGVLERRVATGSIRSIHDWRRNYSLYWITENAHRLFSLLEYGEGLRVRQISSAEGRDFVRLMDERLEEVVFELENLPEAKTEQIALARNEKIRQQYQTLNLLHTQEFRQFKDFLSELNAALVEFGRRPDIDLDELPEVRSWLESYVRDMLVFFRERSNKIVKSARKLRNPPHADMLQLGYDLAREAATTPFGSPTQASHPPPERMVASFIQYFEKRQGLDQQTKRIQQSTADTMRRLDEHYRRLAEQSHVLNLLKLRTHEILAIDFNNAERAQSVERWLANLYAAPPVLFAPRIGSSTERGEPPRPGRSRENRRPPIAGAKVHKATGTALGMKHVDDERAERINTFVESRILRGKDAVKLRVLRIEGLSDFKVLLEAVKADPLHLHSPISREFIFHVEDPRGVPHDPIDIVEWIAPEGTYTGPNLTIKRKIARTSQSEGVEAVEQR